MSIRILANDGISKGGETVLKNAGFEVLEHRVAQDHLANFINENQVNVLLVRSATRYEKTLLMLVRVLKL
jgi:D-3-phosphoglycerate dehydrogenase